MYPSLQEITDASDYQLARWRVLLPKPTNDEQYCLWGILDRLSYDKILRMSPNGDIDELKKQWIRSDIKELLRNE